jgi:hypothetical protein
VKVDPHRRRAAVIDHFTRAGRALEMRQSESPGPLRGNVSPWSVDAGAEVEDLHGTLMAIWVWARHQALTGAPRFEDNRRLGWRFVLEAAVRHLPETISESDYEAPFGCACLLRAVMAERAIDHDDMRSALAEVAFDSLARYVAGLRLAAGREFRDPGFLVWTLAEYSRAVGSERGLVTAAQYARRHFGTEPPPAPVEETCEAGALFDFLSTSSTLVQAVVATQTEPAFVIAYLREYVLPVCPRALSPRAQDEHAWNASVAWLLGTGYRLTLDDGFFDAYRAVLADLEARDRDGDAALGRDAAAREYETLPTWAWALAVDILDSE